jgi:hypothetical protein
VNVLATEIRGKERSHAMLITYRQTRILQPGLAQLTDPAPPRPTALRTAAHNGSTRPKSAATGSLPQSRRVRGNPKWARTLVSLKRVTAEIWLPVSVSTMRPCACQIGVYESSR